MSCSLVYIVGCVLSNIKLTLFITAFVYHIEFQRFAFKVVFDGEMCTAPKFHNRITVNSKSNIAKSVFVLFKMKRVAVTTIQTIRNIFFIKLYQQSRAVAERVGFCFHSNITNNK